MISLGEEKTRMCRVRFYHRAKFNCRSFAHMESCWGAPSPSNAAAMKNGKHHDFGHLLPVSCHTVISKTPLGVFLFSFGPLFCFGGEQ